MAHVLAPQPSIPDLPVFFNLNGAVGAAPAQNLREDVLLVQFYLRTIADKPNSRSDADLDAACRKVQVTGVMDADTIEAIKVRQRLVKADSGNPGTIVDGRVSPARGNGYNYGAIWTIVALNMDIQGRNMEVWPRLDKVPGCPPELKEMVKRVLVGTL